MICKAHIVCRHTSNALSSLKLSPPAMPLSWVIAMHSLPSAHSGYTQRPDHRLMPNTHRRRRRDEIVESRRVGGVFTNSQLVGDSFVVSSVWTHPLAVVTRVVNWPPMAVLCVRIRRQSSRIHVHTADADATPTKQFRLVGVGGVYWAWVFCSYECDVIIIFIDHWVLNSFKTSDVNILFFSTCRCHLTLGRRRKWTVSLIW